MGAGGLWLSLADSFYEATAARLTSGIGAVMLNVLVTKMVADWFEGRDRFLAMAILINAWPIGIGIALLVVGPLGEVAGWQRGILSTALMAAIGFLAVSTIHHAPASSAPATSATGIGLRSLSGKDWQLLLIC